MTIRVMIGWYGGPVKLRQAQTAPKSGFDDCLIAPNICYN